MQMPTQKLRDVPVLVTGATGFVGGALARRLLGEEGAVVTACGRDLTKASGLDGARLEAADLLDAATMEGLVAGQEIVFHVGAWLGSKDDGAAFGVNVTATESLVRQSAAAGVKRFVLVSSVAVYGVPSNGVMDESVPLATEQPYDYGRTKALGDLRARELGAELGLDVVVIRPGMVHGPGGEAWTRGMYDTVKSGVPVLLGDRGHAYTIYIDNLVDLLLLAATSSDAEGAYNAVDAEMNWRRFFGYYADAAGVKLRGVPWRVAKAMARVAEVVPLGIPLNRDRLAFYRAEPTWDRTRAEGLGWEARVAEGEGFRRGVGWVRG
jgi:nucleoside-diphosphate-sugar epimerase